MSDNILDEVDKRANLAFSNHMEMLTFYLADQQQYSINVFKIIEVIETPDTITKMPQAHPAVKGAIDFRGAAVTVIDLSQAMGMDPTNYQDDISYIIVCEYSNSTQGFLITHPNKLMNKSWNDIKRPTGSLYDSGYLTAITYDDLDNAAIQILDIEKILGEIVGIDDQVSSDILQAAGNVEDKRILVVDDSKSARVLVQSALDQLGVRYTILDDAEKAFNALESNLQTESHDPYNLIISDIEMPGMDGFTFTRKVKSDQRFSEIPLVLHSSMSNESNRTKATQVGANGFIPKFQPNAIAKVVLGMNADA